MFVTEDGTEKSKFFAIKINTIFYISKYPKKNINSSLFYWSRTIVAHIFSSSGTNNITVIY
jgi:hypothetical protein